MAVQGEKQPIPCKIPAADFLLVFFCLVGFLNNLVFKQNLLLGRVEGSFPRELGQGEEMDCLRSEPVKTPVTGRLSRLWRK